jgi:tetratricopeptide (TPR) repeat protein
MTRNSRIFCLVLLIPALAYSQEKHYAKASRAFEKEEYQTALKYVERSLEENPSSVESELLKSEILYELKNFDGVIEILTPKAQLETSYRVILSMSLYEANQFVEASKVFKTLLDEEDNALVYNNVAASFFNAEQADSAIYYAKKAVALKPMDSLYNTTLGIAYSANLESDKACAQFFIGLKLHNAQAVEFYIGENCDSWQSQWLEHIEGPEVGEINNTLFPEIGDNAIKANNYYLLIEGDTQRRVKLVGIKVLHLGTIFQFADENKNTFSKLAEEKNMGWALAAAQ